MHFGFTRQPPLKERIVHAIYRLETQLNKLEQTSTKLHQRDREMFERCIGAKASGDDARAAIYANECVEIRKMAKIVLASQLAIERVILRLQTVEDIGDLLIQMAPVAGIIKETKGKLKGIIPEVSYELEEINRLLNNTLTEAGKASVEETLPEEASAEARKVLEEATAIAEQKMNENYPKLPLPPEPTQKTLEQPLTTPGTPIETTVEELPEKNVQLTEPELEEKLLNYIKECGGELNLNKCASFLNVPVEEVKKAVAQLESKGKIIVQ
ncbi:hypothetical protein DRO26_03880 [Candidatus Bathyarchaeota archaeon]|nr:MAG: hypothetical protein DRO26_03880 [Candidatus Bathyarchaeota archaeon]